MPRRELPPMLMSPHVQRLVFAALILSLVMDLVSVEAHNHHRHHRGGRDGGGPPRGGGGGGQRDGGSHRGGNRQGPPDRGNQRGGGPRTREGPFGGDFGSG